jgi:8-oxo-dGTP pyrophosphatase MutT (NUDIX family)
MKTQRVRGIIINEREEVILIERIRPGIEPYWVAPGGALEEEETQREALRREIKEEIGVAISIGKLAFVRETEDTVETFYQCFLSRVDPAPPQAREYSDPEKGEYNIELVPLVYIPDLNILPYELKEYLMNV